MAALLQNNFEKMEESMKSLNLRFMLLIIVTATMILGTLATALAATDNPKPTSPGYTPMVVPILGVYSGSRTAIVKWKAPTGYNVVHASATVRASSGTNPTLKVRANSGAFVNWSTSVTAGSIATAAINKAAIADESTVSYDLVIGGTSPKWSDITLMLLLKRL